MLGAIGTILSKQFLIGLLYLQEKGIVHGDMKPGNIILQPVKDEPQMCQLKICDLDENQILQNGITKTGEISRMDSADKYRAPEFFRKGKIGRKVDIFGCIINEIFGLNEPFYFCRSVVWRKERYSEGRLSNFIAARRDVPEVYKTIPSDIRSFILRCCQQDQTKQRSAADVMEIQFVSNKGICEDVKKIILKVAFSLPTYRRRRHCD